MSTTVNDSYWKASPPWVHVGHPEPGQDMWLPQAFYSRPKKRTQVRVLRSWKMRTTSELMTEFGAALQFFPDFGENWYALDDCLTLLDQWMPADAYVILVDKAECLLAEEGSGQLEALLSALHDAGKYWSRPVDSGPVQYQRPAICFHAILKISDGRKDVLNNILQIGKKASIPLGQV